MVPSRTCRVERNSRVLLCLLLCLLRLPWARHASCRTIFRPPIPNCVQGFSRKRHKGRHKKEMVHQGRVESSDTRAFLCVFFCGFCGYRGRDARPAGRPSDHLFQTASKVLAAEGTKEDTKRKWSIKDASSRAILARFFESSFVPIAVTVGETRALRKIFRPPIPNCVQGFRRKRH